MDAPSLRSFAACLLVCGLANAQESAPPGGTPARRLTHIDRREDVVPPPVIERLDAVQETRGSEHVATMILGDPRARVHLLVNPELLGEDPDEDRLRRLVQVADGNAPPDGVVDVLTLRERGQPVFHAQLKDVLALYLQRFVPNRVETPDRLEDHVDLVVRQGMDDMVLLAADARVQGVATEPRTLEVRLSLRLFRLAVGTAESPVDVRAVELLWSDVASGRAALLDGRTLEEDVRETFRAAVADALHDRLALSMWGNPRLLEAPLFKACASPVGASLNSTAVVGAPEGSS